MASRTLRLILWVPLVLFLGFVGVVAAGLKRPQASTITSQMIGRHVPAFSLAAALPDKPPLGSAVLISGGPHLVNMFASWCLPCAIEAPQVDALARAGIPIEGVVVRDRPDDLADYIRRHGDPYERLGSDNDSRVQMAFGASGVPETFIVDGAGIIRAQHIGPIEPEEVAGLVAQVRALR